MREPLMLQLEKLSYYQHLSLTGGRERRICACRTLEIRGTRYHVLSRIQDAGLDFTGRTNFLAHHLVFTPEEIRQYASPPVILSQWPGWLTAWTKEPENLENEDWSSLPGLSSAGSVPARMWQELSGDAANGYGMLEVRSGASFRVDNVSDEQILALFAESLELWELRDPRRDFRATAWQYTFTTSMQEQDNPADFKWRCLHSDNPASSRFAGPDCRNLTEVKVIRATAEEKSFAQSGRQPPRILIQPKTVFLSEGQAAHLSVKAEGVPVPAYQWYSVDKQDTGQIIPEATGPELTLTNPPFGVSRYVVQVSNSVGAITSEVARVECNEKIKLAKSNTPAAATPQPGINSIDADYETKRDNQRQRIREEEEAREAKNRRIWNKIIMVFGMFVLVVLIATGWLILGSKKKLEATQPNPSPVTAIHEGEAAATNNPAHVVNSDAKSGNSDAPTTNTKSAKQSYIEPLLGGWMAEQIGNVDSFPPEQLHNTNSFEIESSSGAFAAGGDNVIFVYKTNSGSFFDAKITLKSSDGINGIMIRNSLDKNSKFLFIGAAQQVLYVFTRDENGLNTNTWNDSTFRSDVNIALALNNNLKNGKWSPKCDSLQTTNNLEITLSSNALVGFAQIWGTQQSRAKARFVYSP